MELLKVYPCGVGVFWTTAPSQPYLVTHTKDQRSLGVRRLRGNIRHGIVSFERTEDEAHVEAEALVVWLGRFKEFPRLFNGVRWPWSVLEIER